MSRRRRSSSTGSAIALVPALQATSVALSSFAIAAIAEPGSSPASNRFANAIATEPNAESSLPAATSSARVAARTERARWFTRTAPCLEPGGEADCPASRRHFDCNSHEPTEPAHQPHPTPGALRGPDPATGQATSASCKTDKVPLPATACFAEAADARRRDHDRLLTVSPAPPRFAGGRGAEMTRVRRFRSV